MWILNWILNTHLYEVCEYNAEYRSLAIQMNWILNWIIITYSVFNSVFTNTVIGIFGIQFSIHTIEIVGIQYSIRYTLVWQKYAFSIQVSYIDQYSVFSNYAIHLNIQIFSIQRIQYSCIHLPAWLGSLCSSIIDISVTRGFLWSIVILPWFESFLPAM